MSFLPTRLREQLEPRDRVRLHSLSYLFLARVFAVLLVGSVYYVVTGEVEAAAHVGALRAVGEGTLCLLLLAAVVWVLWVRLRVIATRAGLEVRAGRKQRLIPWNQVRDIRELPWLRQNPPWQPRMWQVDLVGGESFDFIGVRRTREIVAAFIPE